MHEGDNGSDRKHSRDQEPEGVQGSALLSRERQGNQTRKEVATKLAKALSDREGGLIFDAEGLKLREYLSRWLEDTVKDSVRNTTYERYEQIARTHIIPMLGDIKLKGLSPDPRAWPL